jgi:hypothetical protein
MDESSTWKRKTLKVVTVLFLIKMFLVALSFVLSFIVLVLGYAQHIPEAVPGKFMVCLGNLTGGSLGELIFPVLVYLALRKLLSE